MILMATQCAALWAYDIAPCLPKPDSKIESGAGIRQAKMRQAEDWEKLILLDKVLVQNRCENAFRWHTLVRDLILGGRQPEAIDVLDEMDRRGFEVKPVGTPELRQLMETGAFAASRLGKKIAQEKELVEKRRAEFRGKLEGLPISERPASKSVDNGACPFEGCIYRDWTVLADCPLVNAPNSSAVVGKAIKGTKITAVTGEVHFEPNPVGVVFDHPPFKKGDIVFLMSYVGEGFYKYWAGGNTGQTDGSVDEYCFHPSPSCWGEYIVPRSTGHKAVWWVNIKLPDGTEGWTNRPDDFGHKDALE